MASWLPARPLFGSAFRRIGVPTMSEAQPGEREFGGSGGTFAIMLISHVLLYYLWAALAYHQGGMFDPRELPRDIIAGALPTWRAAAIYFGFIGLEFFFAWVMPGVWVDG